MKKKYKEFLNKIRSDGLWDIRLFLRSCWKHGVVKTLHHHRITIQERRDFDRAGKRSVTYLYQER